MMLRNKKRLIRLLGLNFLIKLASILLEKKISYCKKEIEQKFIQWVIKRVINITVKIFGIFLFVGLLSTTLLFMSLGLALYLNDLLHSVYQGFLIVGGIYLLLFFIIFTIKNKQWFQNIFFQIIHSKK